MSTATALAPAYMPPDGAPLDVVTVDATWNAVTVPAAWGHLAWDVLGDRSGPVLDDPSADHLMWIIPPGGADAWPDATAAGVHIHRQGAELVVCGLDGYRSGMRWLRVPTARRWDTEPRVLRIALEWITGPLADAEPIQVCVSCGVPTTRGHLLARHSGDSGPGVEIHACRDCWREIARGGPGRHLRVVQKGPL